MGRKGGHSRYEGRENSGKKAKRSGQVLSPVWLKHVVLGEREEHIQCYEIRKRA